jgi:translation initiation factor IF-2
MARTRGMKGPGMIKMGGGGRKPGAPATPMAGKPIGGGGGPPPAMGAPPRAPAAPKPPMSAGAPPPMPGGAGGGLGAPGGMGGSGGFAKGGTVGIGAKKFEKGGDVRKTSGDAKARVKPQGSFE